MDTYVGRESGVVDRIIRHLAVRGAWNVKTTGVGKAGCPDILACYSGYFIAIEVKREHDGAYGVTKKQQHELEQIARAGGGWIVAASVSDVSLLLDDIDTRERQWC